MSRSLQTTLTLAYGQGRICVSGGRQRASALAMAMRVTGSRLLLMLSCATLNVMLQPAGLGRPEPGMDLETSL